LLNHAFKAVPCGSFTDNAQGVASNMIGVFNGVAIHCGAGKRRLSALCRYMGAQDAARCVP
jgi:anaerobic glycerol-3-phosphate dehydrogenase